ncbi:helix-turn-helix transcriptional regulator [Streptomyces asiaticus]
MMTPRRPGASAAGWAVLGLLSYAPGLSGYELKQWADHSLRFFYQAPAMSQIYSELQRLEALGWAESRLEPQGHGRDKRVYGLTEDGAAALKAHVESAPFRPPMVKNPVAMRIWLGHLTGGAGMDRLIDAYDAHLNEFLEGVRAALKTTEDRPELAYAAMALRWIARSNQAQADALGELRRELAEHRAEAPTRKEGTGGPVA